MNIKVKTIINSVILHVIIIIGALMIITPLLWMFYSSFKTVPEIFSYPSWAWPKNILSFHAYKVLFTEWEFLNWYRNSLVYTISTVIIVLFFTSLAGFAFAKYRFKGRNGLFMLLIASALIPFQLMIIPLYIMMSKFGWINSWESMIIPWVAPAFGIFLMRQYILSISDEMLEAPRIDGASEFTIYWRIILPQIKPALTTQATVSFISFWNFYIWPLMVLQGEKNFTLPVGLASMTIRPVGSEMPYDIAMAGGVLVTVPFIIIFVVMQKWIISGLTLGSIKQ